MINNVNLNTVPTFINPHNKGRGKAIPLPANFVEITPKLVDTVSGLTERENEILASIRKLVDGSVMFNLAAHTSSCGFTIVQTGFNGVNTPFMVTHGMLREMAADENMYREHMEQIKILVRAQNNRERLLSENTIRAVHQDAALKSYAIRAKMSL